MSRTHRPVPWPQRRPFDALEAAIRLIEDQIEWMGAHSARMAVAKRGKDAAYASGLLERGRSRLDLLRCARDELLSRERSRGEGGASQSRDRPGRR